MHSPALFQKKGAPRQIKKKARVARRAGRVCVGSQKKARRVLCGDSASLFEKFQWLEVLQKKSSNDWKFWLWCVSALVYVEVCYE